jgi:hypothetical protein
MGRAALLGALIALMSASLATAGGNNDAFIRQVSPAGSELGNTLSIDQSAATDSTVRGIGSELIGKVPFYVLGLLTANDPLAAQQRGESNEAALTITGAGGELQLYQSVGAGANWAPYGAVARNTAVLAAASGALGGVIQIGSENLASLTLGDDATGLISQFGSKLSATLDVGARGQGTVVQQGYNSDAGTIAVASGTSVQFFQSGNNLKAPELPEGVSASVFSTAIGTIIIQQTAW